MGRVSQAKGAVGEQVARMVLNRLDLRMIRRIYTGWIPHRWVDRKRRIAQVYPLEKVVGDFMAITSAGRSVLVEVKQREDRLLWSALAPHQRARLDEHSENCGLSLIVWVTYDTAYILEWPIPGFGPRKSITESRAAELDLTEIST